MIFKIASPGVPAYVFDRNSISIAIGKVVGVVPSHIDTKTAKMVVDLTVQFGEKQQQYTVEDGLSVAYFGNNALTLEREAVLREVESMKMQSEQVLANVEKHKEVVTKCNQLLMDNNPALKEKKETEERFKGLEEKMEKMMEMMGKLME